MPCDGLLDSISDCGYNIGWRKLSYTAQAKRLTKEPPFITFRKGAPKKLLDNLEGFAAAGPTSLKHHFFDFLLFYMF